MRCSRVLSCSAGIACVLAAWMLPSRGAAQPSRPLDAFDAAESPGDDFHVSRPTVPGHLRFGAQLHLDYANDPLVYEARLGEAESELFPVVADQLTANLGLSLGLFDDFVVFAGLPVVLWMDGERMGPFAYGADGAGLSDAYLGGRWRVLGGDEDAWAWAMQVSGTLPTAGSEQRFRGHAVPSLHVESLLELHGRSGWHVVLDLGARIREDVADARSNLRSEDMLTYALAFAVPLGGETSLTHRRGLELHGQLYGRTSFRSFFAREASPLEFILGGRYFLRSGLALGAAAGSGLTRGFGSPDLRLIGSVAWSPPRAEERTDRDGDGIEDEADRCPTEPEDADGFEDEDGCPDPDNDGDGVLDTADRCPTEAGPVENRGCPDQDRDGDTVVDRLDNCPDEPGPPENHGCKERQRVVIRQGRLEILDKVYFRTASDRIQRRSHALLMNVAQVLNAHPEIQKVRVEGHTDSRGARDYNMDLSQRRAEAVVRFLVERGGVAAERLEAKGFGPDRPIVPDARSRRDHARNRRVEFHLLGDGQGIEQQDRGPGDDVVD